LVGLELGGGGLSEGFCGISGAGGIDGEVGGEEGWAQPAATAVTAVSASAASLIFRLSMARGTPYGKMRIVAGNDEAARSTPECEWRGMAAIP
jgi:hypothetical protein